jgi:hypothetical protein
VSEPYPVYLFRDGHFAPAGDTVVSAAPLELVVAVYGDGGLVGEAGLAAAFGGCTYFRNDENGSSYLAIWGARKASRFRSVLRRSGAKMEILHRAPPARLVWWLGST